MKSLCFHKIHITIPFLIFICLGIIFNAFKYLFIFYLLAFFHELFHVFTALIFKVKIKDITFSCLGLSCSLDNTLYLSAKKQILIYIMGPLSFFPLLVIINLLYKYNFFSLYTYKVAFNDNISLLIFNLLPFYPMDGGRILETILLKIMPSKKALFFRNLCSLITSFLLCYLCYLEAQYLLLAFISFNMISYIVFFNKDYHNYLLSRIGLINDFPHKISTFPNIYHFYHNHFLLHNKFINEEDYLLNQEINRLNKISK